jgi:hypothetical protein
MKFKTPQRLNGRMEKKEEILKRSYVCVISPRNE